MSEKIMQIKVTRRNPDKEDEKPIEIIPMRNKYVSGICKTCQNEYTDLEGHYIKYLEHRPKKK